MGSAEIFFKTATIRAFLSFSENLKIRVRPSTLGFSEPRKKRQKSIKFSPFYREGYYLPVGQISRRRHIAAAGSSRRRCIALPTGKNIVSSLLQGNHFGRCGARCTIEITLKTACFQRNYFLFFLFKISKCINA